MSDRLEEIKKLHDKCWCFDEQATCAVCWLIAEVELWRKRWDSESDEADVLRDQLDEARADLAAAQTGFQAALKDLGEARAEVERLRGELDWHRQTVHRAHHDQPMETCEKNTCQGARKALEKGDG